MTQARINGPKRRILLEDQEEVQLVFQSGIKAMLVLVVQKTFGSMILARINGHQKQILGYGEGQDLMRLVFPSEIKGFIGTGWDGLVIDGTGDFWEYGSKY